MAIKAGGVEVDIRGKIEQLDRDLAAAETKLKEFDSKRKRSVDQQAAYELKAKRDSIKAQLAEVQKLAQIEESTAKKAAQAKLTAEKQYAREVQIVEDAIQARKKKSLDAQVAAEKAALVQFKAIQSEREKAQAKSSQDWFNKQLGVGQSSGSQISRSTSMFGGAQPSQDAHVAAWKAQVAATKEADIAAKKLASSIAEASREQQDLFNRTNRLASAYDPLFAAQLRLNHEIAEANALRKAGMIDQAREATFVNQATQRFEQFQRSQKKGGGLATHQLTNLSFQANDVISGLMMGQGVGQIAAQQGGQIFQILQQSQGGVAGGLKSIGGLLVGLINPLTLTATGVLALAAAFAALAARQADSEQAIRTFDAQVGTIAGSENFNPKKIEDIARSLDVFGGSIQDVRANLSEFIRQGIAEDKFEALGKASEYLAKIWKVDLKDAGKTLATAFSGGYDQIKALNDQYPFLDENQRKSIKNDFKAGKAGEARNEAFRIFTEKYAKEYEESLTQADLATKALAGSWDNLVSALSNTGAVEYATNSIIGLVGALTDWLAQYAKVQNLTSGQLKTRSMENAQKQSEAGMRLKNAQDAVDAYGSNPKRTMRYESAVRVRDQAKEAYDAAAGSTNEAIDEILGRRVPPAGDTVTSNTAARDKAQTKVPKAKKDPKDEFDRAIKSIKDQTEALRIQSSVRADLNAKVAMGLITSEEASRQLEVSNKLDEYQAKLARAKGKDYDELRGLIEKYRAELEKANAIEIATQTLAATNAQVKQNQALEQQLALIGKTNRERAVAIAQMQAEQDLKDMGENDPSRRANYIAGKVRGAELGSDIESKEYVESIRKSVEASTKAYEIKAATIGMTRKEAEKYTFVQEQLNQAEAAGIELTGAKIEAIRMQGEAYSVTAENAHRLDEIMEASKFVTDEIYGAIEGLAMGTDSWADSLRNLAKALDQAALKAALLGEGPLAGLMGTSNSGGLLGMIGKAAGSVLAGGLGGGKITLNPGVGGGVTLGVPEATMTMPSIPVSVHHEGGMVGQASRSRMMPVASFVNAPRFHKGLFANDEFPAVLQTGEEVIPRGGRRGGNTIVNINGVTDFASFKKSERQVQSSIGRAVNRTAGRG